MRFLMRANEEISALAWARVTVLMKQPRHRRNELQSKGRAALAALEARLRDHQWVAIDHATIADIACFPYVGMAAQGEVSLGERLHEYARMGAMKGTAVAKGCGP
ncbi:MAG: hypothetical protein EXR11_13710 [Rhodospirillaceae bacterium]|nr:hypothetical protein [Rhodospirillaceae bacterium]